MKINSQIWVTKFWNYNDYPLMTEKIISENVMNIISQTLNCFMAGALRRTYFLHESQKPTVLM
jgi:hypothetical protein